MTGIQTGLWDYQCLANNTGTPVGGATTKFGTQPTSPYFGGTGAGFYYIFTLNNSLHQLNLYSWDGANLAAIHTNQPFTTTAGKCNPLDAQQKKPRAIDVP